MINRLSLLCLTLQLICPLNSAAQEKLTFNRADTLRGSIGEGRAWWDLDHYDLGVEPDYLAKTIKGVNHIRYRILQENHPGYMQIDLQEPMQLDSVLLDGRKVSHRRDKNAFFIEVTQGRKNTLHVLSCYFSGQPRIAVQAPWDGGWIWTKDKSGNPWMTVACQGLGASVWYPCKDHQSDKPDHGAVLRITVPDTLTAVGNGRLTGELMLDKNRKRFEWTVTNPINNYNIVPYIGKYQRFGSLYNGEKGRLDLDYWVMPYNYEKAKKQFEDVPRMLNAFEYWFGPYPFYEDGYKLVESPHLGMEHQSAIAYGNGYRNGYMGRDLSSSGWGLKWDFIIIHESGHEWFANNITTKDIADMWVHEGFTNYSETLFTDYHYGRQAGNAYVIGTRALIQNDIPIIGPYGVNKEGSGDMYYKGGNMIHFIRQVINDDSLFRRILRDMNSRFRHRTVTSSEIESFISRESGHDFTALFDLFLRSTNIPELEYRQKGKRTWFRWSANTGNLRLPVRVISSGVSYSIRPSSRWKKLRKGTSEVPEVDPNYYLLLKKVEN